MADEDKGSSSRDYRGVEGAVDDATAPGETKFERGRTGASTPKSPKKWPADKTKRTGEEGEPAYGPPLSTPKPKDAKPRTDVKPDPLKKK